MAGIRTVVLAVVAIAVLGGAMYFAWPHSLGINASIPSEEESSGFKVGEEEQAAVVKEEAPTSDSSAPASTSGTYEDYAPSKLSLAQNGKVVLYFHADWCPICRNLESETTKLPALIPPGVRILKVNYDRETELKQKYGVTYQHTFVQVDASGNQIAKWGDATTLAGVIRKIQ